jgi:hypothetical protein
MDDPGLREGFEWEDAEDVTAHSEDELRDTLAALSEEERVVSYRRRILQGRMDLIRAELVARGAVSRSPRDLARVLLGDLPGEEVR